MSVDERELPALEEHAAIGAGEAAAALRSVRDHLAHGKLAQKRLSLRLEIHAGRETIEFVGSGVGAAQLRDHRGQVARGPGGGLGYVVIRRSRWTCIGLRLGQTGLTLRIEQLGDINLRQRRARCGKQRLARRSGLSRCNSRRGKRSNHQQRRANRSQHSDRRTCG